jgi:hypothetical protein
MMATASGCTTATQVKPCAVPSLRPQAGAALLPPEPEAASSHGDGARERSQHYVPTLGKAWVETGFSQPAAAKEKHSAEAACPGKQSPKLPKRWS